MLDGNRTARYRKYQGDKRSTLRIRWRGKRAGDLVDLTGWIATGGDTLSTLKDAETFAQDGAGWQTRITRICAGSRS